jgi:hypothetical protein
MAKKGKKKGGRRQKRDVIKRLTVLNAGAVLATSATLADHASSLFSGEGQSVHPNSITLKEIVDNPSGSFASATKFLPDRLSQKPMEHAVAGLGPIVLQKVAKRKFPSEYKWLERLLASVMP